MALIRFTLPRFTLFWNTGCHFLECLLDKTRNKAERMQNKFLSRVALFFSTQTICVEHYLAKKRIIIFYLI